MSENISKLDNLSKFGATYQAKVIACLIYDDKFLSQVYDILHDKFFESEANQWIVEKIKEYYKQYKTSPTLEVFKTKIEQEANEVFQNNLIKKLKEAYDLQQEKDLNYTKDNFVEFCINQNYKLAVYDSIEDIKKGDYDEIKRKFKNAFIAGQNRDIGLFLLDETVKDVMNEAQRNTIPTPWEIINELTEGGIGDSETGELFLVTAGPGAGKSWVLCNVGVAGLTKGKIVVHYSLELGRKLIAKRYYSLFTGLPVTELKFNENDIEKRVNTIKGNNGKLIIKTYPTKKASVETISAHLNSLMTGGIKPDVVIIDYADLLKAPKFYKDKRLEIGNIYEEVRGLSGELRIPIWSASQVNRTGAQADIIEGEHISEDFSKIMIGDFIFSVSRKREDNEEKTARIYIIKNRFGADKLVYPASFNVNNGSLNIFEKDSLQGQNLNKKMNGDGQIRKILKEKYYKEKQ